MEKTAIMAETLFARALELPAGAAREAFLIRQCGQDAALHSDLGTILARLGRFRDAVPEFETALRLDPTLDTARRNLAAARARLER